MKVVWRTFVIILLLQGICVANGENLVTKFMRILVLHLCIMMLLQSIFVAK